MPTRLTSVETVHDEGLWLFTASDGSEQTEVT